VVRGSRNEDRPVTGRFWIATDGRILKCEMAMAFDGNRWSMTTTFSDEPALGLAVPAEMVERFDVDFIVISGRATYGRFRSFGVMTDERVGQTGTPDSRPGER
jgi:hypothetical protein